MNKNKAYMKNILLISNSSLKSPTRGTPLRVLSFIRQINKEHNILICLADAPDDLRNIFISYPKMGKVRKLLFFARLIRERKIDIVMIATEVEIKLPVMLKLITGVKIAIDIHGLLPEELFYKKTIGKIKKTFYDGVTKFFLTFYDVVFVCADKLRDYYNRANSNIEIIYGGVNLKEFDHIIKKEERSFFTVGYMGNSRPYQGLDYLLKALSSIKKKRLFSFRLNLILSDKSKEDILSSIKEFGISTEELLLSLNVEHDKVNQIIQNSDVLVIPRPSIPMTEYAFPSKFPEYLATGIPIIITNVGPVRNSSKTQKLCLVIQPDNIADSIEEKLRAVYSMSDTEKALIFEKSRAVAREEFDWDILGKKLNQILSRL